jgi:prepilin-type processing-associated H-X9-DG protein
MLSGTAEILILSSRQKHPILQDGTRSVPTTFFICMQKESAMSIRFTCPHCGNATDVAEEYAGQNGTCVQCGKTITVPPLGVAPLQCNQIPPKKPMSAVSIILIVFLVCGGVLAALFQPAINAHGEAARRAACSNNLKQIGLAIHSYYEKYGHFPPAYTVDKDGKPMHSWRVLILPFMEYRSLYNQFKMDEPWNSPHNLALSDQIPPQYRCPNNTSPSKSASSYAMLVGPHAISTGQAGRTKAEITDGLANTIMIVETAGSNINWLEPRDLDVEIMSFDLAENASTELNSDHPEMVNVLFCDGHVQSLSKESDPDTVKAMTTVDGAEQTMPGDVLEPVSK